MEHSIQEKIRSFGGVFAFLYDPKYKDVLPYYDKFPIVIPFGVENDSFIGLNLHYLPVEERRKLLTFLMGHKTKKTTREYMNISYRALVASSHVESVKPCIHKYLKSHLRSRLVKISHEEWENVIALPTAQWVKGSPY